MKKFKVAVIMSTYNGEKFLKEQLDSILSQKDVEVDIYIFDDCSKDRTVEIARDYEKNNKNIHLNINEKNKNYTYNFIDGLFTFKNKSDYDYYAFADQDDVWVEDKLITAINAINQKGKCTLYSSDLTVVDENLNSMGRTLRGPDFAFEWHDQLCFCMVTGCTAVFDKEFKDLVTQHYPENLLYHDYWIGLIANYCKDANYIFDKDASHILYRQHGKNASGGAITWGFFDRLLGMFKGYEQNFHILRLLLKYYGDKLNSDDKELIEKFINYKKWKNKKYVLKHFKTTKPSKFKFKILFNRYIEKK